MIKRALCILCIISQTLLLGGETGKITGRITDSQTGDPLIGVNILFQDMNIGTSTDASGDYILINIPAARYTITASYIGYRSVTMTDVVINADRTTVVDVQMEVLFWAILSNSLLRSGFKDDLILPTGSSLSLFTAFPPLEFYDRHPGLCHRNVGQQTHIRTIGIFTHDKFISGHDAKIF